MFAGVQGLCLRYLIPISCDEEIGASTPVERKSKDGRFHAAFFL